MTEIRDTFQDAEIEGGGGMGRRHPRHRPLHLSRRFEWASLKLPQQGPEQSPSRNWIWCVLSSTERISERQKTSKWSTTFWSTAWRLTHLGGTNSGQGSEFGTIQLPEWPRIFSGQALKIRNRPEKFGTDGHLNCDGGYGRWGHKMASCRIICSKADQTRITEIWEP